MKLYQFSAVFVLWHCLADVSSLATVIVLKGVNLSGNCGAASVGVGMGDIWFIEWVDIGHHRVSEADILSVNRSSERKTEG